MKSSLRSSAPAPAQRPVLGLEERIRQVRRGIRAKQPLQTRIDLVRERHAAAKRSAEDEARPTKPKGAPPEHADPSPDPRPLRDLDSRLQ